MKPKDHIKSLSALYISFVGHEPSVVTPIDSGSASPRRYYRLSGKSRTLIGAISRNVAENRSFFYLTDHFLSHGLTVPEVYCADETEQYYLQQDLGDISLHDYMAGGFRPEHETFLIQALENLVLFQVKASCGIDFNRCYPQPIYDRQAATWDLNYFKYMFIKLSGLDFDEHRMEEEFSLLLDTLFKDNIDGFMYRDFQSRNIMINHDRLWFIDYQGGRQGPLAYDVASLLYQSRIAVPEEVRERLTAGYCGFLKEYLEFEEEGFYGQVRGFAVLRLLQNLGAYGYRGIFERKPKFIEPIIPALRNVIEIISTLPDSSRPDYLLELLREILPVFDTMVHDTAGLTVTVNSFSFMQGLPRDDSGNGGGFVFDCRALPNPHRDESLRPFTGKDKVICNWFETKPEVDQFIDRCEELVMASIQNYSERGFQNLQISFGCTGGKHRSVYCAEKLAERLLPKCKNLKVSVKVKHCGNAF